MGRVPPHQVLRTHPGGIGLPKPLMGAVLDAYGGVEFGVNGDGHGRDRRQHSSIRPVTFDPPSASSSNGPGIPLVNYAATLGTGGTLASGKILYYAVSGVDGSGTRAVFRSCDGGHTTGQQQRHPFRLELHAGNRIL